MWTRHLFRGERMAPRRSALVAGVLAVSLAACGGGGGGGDDSSGSEPPSDGGTEALVLTRDSSVGTVSVFPIDSPADVRQNIGEVHSDSVARQWGGRVYVINRLGADNIQALDPADDYRTLWQCSVGNGANPQDIAFVSEDKAYVALYGDTDVLVVDPSVGARCDGFIRGRISLSAFADSDGLPEPAAVAVAQGRLYVAMQLLDQNNGFTVTDRSLVAVIDTDTDSVIDVDPATPEADAIVLTGTNPFSEFIVDEAAGKLMIAEVGSFSDIADGGIDVIDIATNRAEGYLISEAELGGNLSSIALVDDERGYAIVLDENFSNLLVRFDLATRSVAATLYASDSFLPDIEYSSERDELYLTDRDDTLPGIRVFRGSDDQQEFSDPIDVGLPPNGILLVDAE